MTLSSPPSQLLSRLPIALIALSLLASISLSQQAFAAPFYKSLQANELKELPTPVVAASLEVPDAMLKVTNTVKQSHVTIEGRPYTTAIQLNISKKLKKPWLAQASLKNTMPIKKGDVLLIAFDARCVRTSDATSYGLASVNIAQAKKPYGKSFTSNLEISPGWTRYFIRGVAKHDYAPGEGKIEFFLGKRQQVLDIGGMTWMNFGSKISVTDLPTIDLGLDYKGRGADAQWRKDAHKRIDKLRKADLAINIVDANGNPVTGATVKATMTRHAFQWGTTIDLRPTQKSEQGERGAKELENLIVGSKMFNLLVPGNVLKWHALEGEFGQFYTRKRADQVVQWGLDRGFDVKGHVLVWNLPKAVHKRTGSDPAKIRKALQEHIKDLTTSYKGKLKIWDVINENYIHRNTTNLVGDEEVVNWFKWAREHVGPDVPLLWNEIHVLPDTERGKKAREYTKKRIKELQAAGAPITTLGIQSHLGVGTSPDPEMVLQRFDEMAALGVNIHITEFDVAIRDTQDPDQVSFQRDYTADFVTAAFSHPAVDCIIYWTPYAYRWIPNSGLADKNWKLRPHGEKLKELITKTWWTNEAHTTQQDGKVSLRGFKGDYTISIKHGDKTKEVTYSLKDKSTPLTITLP